jgi:hypothetical protein
MRGSDYQPPMNNGPLSLSPPREVVSPFTSRGVFVLKVL